MPESYPSAARRHLDDSYHLLSAGRYDNAAYLSGYVVECSFKLLLAQVRDAAPRAYLHDLGILSGDALYLSLLLAPLVGRYQVCRAAELDDVIKNWGPDLRYVATGHTSMAQAESWFRAAKEVYTAVTVKLVLDGRVGG